MTTQQLIDAYYSQRPIGVQSNIRITGMSFSTPHPGEKVVEEVDPINRAITREYKGMRITFTLRKFDS